MTHDASAQWYVFDPGSVDLERLKLAADRLNDDTLAACARAGVRPGDRVLDVGCGPGSALPVLAEVVGDEGIVVGLDKSTEVLLAARDALQTDVALPNVHLVEGDINMRPTDVLATWAPFDMALCRLLLTHQLDPAATLRSIAREIRPGGRIIAIEPLRNASFPRQDPPVAALERIHQLDVAHLQHRGLAWDVAWDYADLCERSGLDLLDWRGTLVLATHDRWQLAFARRLLLAQQTGLLETGLTTQSEIESLVQEVDQALEQEVHRSASSLLVTMIAEVPHPQRPAR